MKRNLIHVTHQTSSTVCSSLTDLPYASRNSGWEISGFVNGGCGGSGAIYIFLSLIALSSTSLNREDDWLASRATGLVVHEPPSMIADETEC